MLTVGLDLVEISRMEHSLQNERFWQRVFGPAEQEELRRKASPAESAAACFAAKEAFSKALGTGVRGFSLCEVEVVHNALGAPKFRLSGRAAALAAEQGLEFALSLTHTGGFAAAVVIAQTKNV